MFVFPIYRNPKIVLSFLSQLQIGRGENDATVFGMPQWADFNQLDASVMEDLGVLITGGLRVDPEDFDTRDFIDTYVQRYGALPTDAAYLGYDAIRYVVPLANRYGRAWTQHLPPSFDGLASDYRLVPVADGDDATNDGYTNSSVKVLEYRDFRFEEVR